MEVSSSEIKDEKYFEDGSTATCRFCYQCNGEKDEGLISPCMCKGTQQFVHRSCLDHWRSVKKGFDFSHCPTCKAQFHLRVVGNIWRKIKAGLFVAGDVLLFLALQPVIGILGGSAYLLDMYTNGYIKNLLINNHWDQILSRHPIPIYWGIGLFAFFTSFVLLGLIVGSCWFIKDETLQIRIEPYDYHYSNMDFFFVKCLIYLVMFGILSIMLLLFVATLVIIFYILFMWEIHYLFLAKKELTKAYVVEDLHGCYTHAKLDPNHLERLKTLNLFYVNNNNNNNNNLIQFLKIVCRAFFRALLYTILFLKPGMLMLLRS